MSCSTTSLLAGTITTTTKNTLTIDDPYIFTETVPTTPPTLFSNSQKSKIRFETRPQQKQQQQQIAQTAPTTIVAAGGGGGGGVALRATVQKLQTNNNRDNFYLKGRNYVAQTQTQTSAENFIKYTPTQTLQLLQQQQQQQTTTAQQNNVVIHQTPTPPPPTAVLGVLNTNNIKKYEKKITTTATAKQTPQLRHQKQTQHVFAAQNENLIEKSPQLELQTTQQPPQQQTKSLSTTPPPLLLPHTPSLWQTPLLLESTPTTATNKAQTTPPASVRISLAPRTTSQPLSKPALPTAATALITPPVAPVGGVTTTTTLAPGTVAPLHLLMSSAAPLPPSNFHHTTLAEHLQKLQCLKKPKKADTQLTAAAAATIPATAKQTLPPPPVVSAAALTTASPKQNQKHSTTATANDLNEIPVNVIYRAATMTPKTTTSPLTSLPARATPAIPAEPPAAKIKNSTPLPPPPAPLLLNRPTQAGNVSKVTVPTATQMMPQMSTTSPTVVTQKAAKKLTTPKQKPAKASKRRAAVVPLPSPHSHSPPKAQKRFRKSNVFPVLLNERERVALPMLLPNIPLSTKAVAIVKRPLNEFAQFDSTLYAADDDNELPFCVQRHWFTLHHQQQQQQRQSQLSSMGAGGCRGREERISNYKSLLRRQAMQLLATRSLQRLPFNVARKRLICVDALLRKYRDHNKIASSPNKKCEIEFCQNVALTMTTLCQQHMAKNSKQSIFVLCSAKNVVENFVQQPQQQQQAATATTTTCNVPVLNIQKQHTPPLCQRHLSKLQQQQQRRLNNIVGNSESKVSAAATNRKRKSNTAAAAAAAIKQNPTTPTALTVDATTTLLHSSSRQHDNSRKINMQRKNSTTSLESIASNSQSSFGSVTAAAATNLPTSHMISPPALAPLSYNTTTDLQQQTQRAFPAGIIDPVAEQEINKLVAQFAMAAAAKSAANGNCANNNNNNNNANNHIINNNNNQLNSFNFMLNTNSNSNLTSSGVGGGSSSSLPSSSTADELLTQDMLSNCENSISAYASSSEDTGLGELSESELMAVSSSLAENIAAHGDDDGNVAATASAIVNGFANIGGNRSGCDDDGGVGIVGSAFNDDDVIADEIPLGDARLLEETDLVNVFGTLPVNLNELFNAVVQQDEREEVERALEIADKHLRSLQQTIGSETDFLADLLNVNDDMLNVGDDEDVDVDICSKMEIVSSVLPPNESLEAAALYLENADKILSNSNNASIGSVNGVNGAAANITMPSNCANNNGTNNAGGGIMDIRGGLLQT